MTPDGSLAEVGYVVWFLHGVKAILGTESGYITQPANTGPIQISKF
jgi:hypothetical protein